MMTFRRAIGAVLVASCLLSSTPSRAAMTLGDALRLTHEKNSELKSLAASTRAAAARRVDAGRLANPDLSLTTENLGIDDRGETAVTLSQPLELGGERGARRDVAEALALEASYERSSAERRALDETAERFLEVWSLQERSALLRSGLELAAQVVAAASERFRVGAGPEVERVRAEGQKALRAAEARTAEGELEAAKRSLALQWGGDPQVESVSLAAPDARLVPPADSLLATLASHPDQLAAAAAVAAEEARIREARAARIPDLVLEGGIKRLGETGTTGAIAGMSITLPIWNRGRGAETAAVAERDAALAREEAGKALLSAEIRNSHDRLAAALDVIASIREQVAPRSREALSLITDGYRAGRFSYVELADAQRALLEAEVAAVDASADAWRARAELARLAGVPLTETSEGGGR